MEIIKIDTFTHSLQKNVIWHCCDIVYHTTVSYDIFLKRVSECVNFYDFHFFYYLLSISISSFAVYSHACVLLYIDVHGCVFTQFTAIHRDENHLAISRNF